MSTRRRRRDGAVTGLVLLVPLAGAAACIIPDRDIRFEGEFDNEGAVRIVQPIELPQEMLDVCNAMDKHIRDTSYCPQVPRTLQAGLVQLDAGPFCVCPSGADTRVLPEFFIYAEDPDRAQDEPLDTLYAVALRDFDPAAADADEPQNAVAYRGQLEPGREAELVRKRNVSLDFSLVFPSEGREDNLLWRFRFGKDGGAGTDLCNDDDGESIGVGLHNLAVMVTDRPFFRPEVRDADGEVVLDQDGDPVLGPVQYGMPDLAIGATYAVASWVFECKDPMVETDCACDEG